MDQQNRQQRVEMRPELGPEVNPQDPVEAFVESIAIRGTYEKLSIDDVKAAVVDAVIDGVLTEDQALQAAISLQLIDEE